jgi:hypothetical protein
MKARFRRAALWTVVGALVVLCARWLAYAVAPGPAARLLEQEAGGPRLPVLALVVLTLGAGSAIAVCWLAALGIHERALLERRVLTSPPPRLRVGRTLVHAFALGVSTSIAGGLVEAYIHWRSGLGWHGLHCVFGPAHRDLLPFEGAFSLIAVALLAAGELVVAWVRRTFALLRTVPATRRFRVPSPTLRALELPRTVLYAGGGTPRAPPARS